MHYRLVIAALLFGSIISTAQDSLQVVSRTPLPPELQTQFGWGDLRVGCAENGNTLLALVPPIEKSTHEIVVLTPGATLRARIDIEKVPGLERADIADFAPGPNGEIYVIARRVIWQRLKRGQKGQITWAQRRLDTTAWIVRFDATGQLLAKVAMPVGFSSVRIAVFPSGSLFAVGYLQDAYSPSFAGVISQNGAVVVPVNLPDTVLDRHPDSSRAIVLPVPILAENGTVYVVMTGENPVVASVNAAGDVLSTVKLRIPNGYHLGEPRATGERIIAELAPDKFQPSDHFVELDASTGEILSLHSVPSHDWKLVCQTHSSSIVALKASAGSFDVLATSNKETGVQY